MTVSVEAFAQPAGVSPVQFGAVRDFHACPGTLDPRLAQRQPLGRYAVVLLPAHFLNGMGPGQGEGWRGDLCPDRAGQPQAQADHAVAT